jgi:hypothetical protein
MIWTREHDRVLAEIEGLTVERHVFNRHYRDEYPEEFIDDLCYWNMEWDCWVAISHYNLSIADAIRAAEAWVGQDPDVRYYEIGRYLQLTGQPKFHVYAYQGRGFGSKCFIGTSDTPAEALSAALYKAVK